MKKILKLGGTILFWLGWPVWSVYFHISPQRSRVLVVCGEEALLIKEWFGVGKWKLPGGGAHPGETLGASAIRELKEEVGIVAAETALRPVGEYLHHDYGLRYYAHYFVLELEEKPIIKKRWWEISDAEWYRLTDIRGRMLGSDAAYVLKQYEPMDQTTLELT